MIGVVAMCLCGAGLGRWHRVVTGGGSTASCERVQGMYGGGVDMVMMGVLFDPSRLFCFEVSFLPFNHVARGSTNRLHAREVKTCNSVQC